MNQQTVSPVEEVRTTFLNPEQKMSGLKDEPTKEEVKVEVKEEEKKEDVTSKRFAALSNKEKHIFETKKQVQRELKAKEEAISKREEALATREARLKEYDELLDLAGKNPDAAAKKIKLDYKNWTDQILSDGKLTPELVAKSTNEEVAKIRQEFEDYKKSVTEDRQKSLEQEQTRLKKVFDDNVIETITNDAEKYKAINRYSQAQVVPRMIEQHFWETKKAGAPVVLKAHEAAQLLEDYLRAEIKRGADIVELSDQSKDKAKEALATQPKPTSGQTKTITNQLQSSVPSILSPQTEADRIRRALEKLA